MFYIGYQTATDTGSLIVPQHIEAHKILTVFENDVSVLAYTLGALCGSEILSWTKEDMKAHSNMFRLMPLTKLVAVLSPIVQACQNSDAIEKKDEEGQSRFDVIRDTVSHLPLDKLEAVAAQSLHHLFEMTAFKPSEFQKANSIAFLRETLPDVEA